MNNEPKKPAWQVWYDKVNAGTDSQGGSILVSTIQLNNLVVARNGAEDWISKQQAALAGANLREKDLLERMQKMEGQLDQLLAHCPDAECPVCAKIICPEGDPFHFHHDGCPSCVNGDAMLAARTNEPR